MIYTGSRYEKGSVIVPQPDSTVAVRRSFPTHGTTYVLHTWRASDRLDRLAARFFGKSEDWWKIADANPLIQNPYDIRPGQQIRIPYRA